MKSSRFSLSSLLAVALALPLSSCMQNSNVIHVKKDGSGEIWAQYFFSPQAVGMLGMMSGGLAGLGGDPSAAGAPAAPDANAILHPTKDSLTGSATGYGPGVRYQRHETAKNDAGWDGYLVVYEFSDISQLKFDPNNPPGPMAEFAKMNPNAVADATSKLSEEKGMGFSMANGVLTVNTGLSEETLSKVTEMGEGGGNPLGGGGGAPALPGQGGGNVTGPDGQEISPQAAMGMAAAMMQGMRMAHFLQIEPAIASTNASHVKGNLITLSDMEPAKMMTDPKFMETMKAAEAFEGKKPDGAALKQMIGSVNELDGVTIETQETITVKFP